MRPYEKESIENPSSALLHLNRLSLHLRARITALTAFLEYCVRSVVCMQPLFLWGAPTPVVRSSSETARRQINRSAKEPQRC